MTPVAFQLGALTVYWHGLWWSVAALVAAYVAARQAPTYGEHPGHVWRVLPWVILFALVGGRVYHVISRPPVDFAGWAYYQSRPAAIFALNGGAWRGFGLVGALGGGILALFLYTRYYQLSLRRWLDIAAPGLLLAQAIGRIGNVINQEIYGPPTTLPWGLFIDASHRVGPYRDLVMYPLETTRFHPVALYEAVWNLIGFGVLLGVSRCVKDRARPGEIFLGYAVWYSVGRLALDNLRVDVWRLPLFSLSVEQFLSILIITTVVVIQGYRWRSSKEP